MRQKKTTEKKEKNIRTAPRRGRGRLEKTTTPRGLWSMDPPWMSSSSSLFRLVLAYRHPSQRNNNGRRWQQSREDPSKAKPKTLFLLRHFLCPVPISKFHYLSACFFLLLRKWRRKPLSVFFSSSRCVFVCCFFFFFAIHHIYICCFFRAVIFDSRRTDVSSIVRQLVDITSHHVWFRCMLYYL